MEPLDMGCVGISMALTNVNAARGRRLGAFPPSPGTRNDSPTCRQ